MLIKILEKDSEKRGEIFEKMIANLLKKMGYKNIEMRSRFHGSEIDIKATDGMLNIPVICECKANEKNKVNNPEIVKFFGKYSDISKKEGQIRGLFFSLTSLNSPAEEFYNAQRGDENKFYFYGPKEIVEYLGHFQDIISASNIKSLAEYEIRRFTSESIKIKEFYLTYFKDEYFWTVILSSDIGEEYLILNREGKLIESKEKLSEFYKHDSRLRETEGYFLRSGKIEGKIKIFLQVISLLEESKNYDGIRVIFDEIDKTIDTISDVNIKLLEKIIIEKENVAKEIINNLKKLCGEDKFNLSIPSLSFALLKSTMDIRKRFKELKLSIDNRIDIFKIIVRASYYSLKIEAGDRYFRKVKRYYRKIGKGDIAETYHKEIREDIESYINMLYTQVDSYKNMLYTQVEVDRDKELKDDIQLFKKSIIFKGL